MPQKIGENEKNGRAHPNKSLLHPYVCKRLFDLSNFAETCICRPTKLNHRCCFAPLNTAKICACDVTIPANGHRWWQLTDNDGSSCAHLNSWEAALRSCFASCVEATDVVRLELLQKFFASILILLILQYRVHRFTLPHRGTRLLLLLKRASVFD